MADKRTHIQQIAHNEALIEALSTMSYPDWVATATFYAALHCMQAYLMSKPQPEYPTNHGIRSAAIDNDSFLTSIRNNYRDLQDVSEAGRYKCTKPSSDDLKKAAADLAAIKKHLKQYIS